MSRARASECGMPAGKRTEGSPRIRVGIDLTYLRPGEVGGTETYAREIVLRLRERPELEIVLFVSRIFRESGDPLLEGVPVFALPVSGRSRVLRVLGAQTLLPILVRRSRVELLHSLGYTAPLLARVPRLVTIHDTNFARVPMTPLRKLFLGRIVRASARTAVRVLTVSEFSRSEIVERLGVPAGNIVVTPNAPRADLAGGGLPLAERSKTVLAFSSPDPHKNVARLARAFRSVADRLPGYELRIVGHVPQGLREEFAGATGVRFLGYVDREEIVREYRTASLFVMPSLYEGFGIPLVEALACSLPSVASDRGALPEVGGDAVLYFDPESEPAIADALVRGLTDTDLRERLARLAPPQAARFSWDASAATIAGLYREVASDTRERAAEPREARR